MAPIINSRVLRIRRIASHFDKFKSVAYSVKVSQSGNIFLRCFEFRDVQFMHPSLFGSALAFTSKYLRTNAFELLPPATEQRTTNSQIATRLGMPLTVFRHLLHRSFLEQQAASASQSFQPTSRIELQSFSACELGIRLPREKSYLNYKSWTLVGNLIANLLIIVTEVRLLRRFRGILQGYKPRQFALLSTAHN